eukprot:CAMPEP_0194398806 /NCGR_PEP_ID=MMETSP0174-20130528/126312_1 /TAXON_ID=216777 /ORGANISM="Proboscia alata, Strain PI-D3" /LENGTH=406 /DNA_ID=CAMNT_0039195151 /DNA_START=1207 /DNA_END=2423 /DNA_ORIENTATION=-
MQRVLLSNYRSAATHTSITASYRSLPQIACVNGSTTNVDGIISGRRWNGTNSSTYTTTSYSPYAFGLGNGLCGTGQIAVNGSTTNIDGIIGRRWNGTNSSTTTSYSPVFGLGNGCGTGLSRIPRVGYVTPSYAPSRIPIGNTHLWNIVRAHPSSAPFSSEAAIAPIKSSKRKKRKAVRNKKFKDNPKASKNTFPTLTNEVGRDIFTVKELNQPQSIARHTLQLNHKNAMNQQQNVLRNLSSMGVISSYNEELAVIPGSGGSKKGGGPKGGERFVTHLRYTLHPSNLSLLGGGSLGTSVTGSSTSITMVNSGMAQSKKESRTLAAMDFLTQLHTDHSLSPHNMPTPSERNKLQKKMWKRELKRSKSMLDLIGCDSRSTLCSVEDGGKKNGGPYKALFSARVVTPGRG